MGLTAAHYDSTADILSEDFDKDVTTLMTMYGNIMIRDDTEQLGPDLEKEDARWNEEIESRRGGFDWTVYAPIEIAGSVVPDVPNVGTSTEK